MIHEKCAGAIVLHDGKVLLIQKARTFYWGLPKGRIDKGETEEQTAVREIKEETGLSVRLVPGFRKVTRYQFKEGEKEIEKETIFFIAKSPTDVVRPKQDEIVTAEWFSPAAALAKVTFSDLRESLEEAFAFMHDKGVKDPLRGSDLPLTDANKSCGAVVLFKGKILLIRHAQSKLWMFPKGGARVGETEEQTAIRAVKEETGLDVELLPDFRYVQHYRYRDRSRRVDKETAIFLAIATTRKTKTPEDYVNLKWFDPHEALDKLSYDDTKDALEAALEVAR